MDALTRPTDFPVAYDDYEEFRELDHLLVHRFTDGPINKVALMELGSYAVSLDIVSRSRKQLAGFRLPCGLAQGSIPYDPKPRLYDKAVQEVQTRAFPEWQGIMTDEEPDACVILSTHIIRASLPDPATIAFLQAVTETTGVPAHMQTVASAKLEARLAAKAMLLGGHTNGLGFMTGGGSLELWSLRNGHIVEIGTEPVGVHSLPNCDNCGEIVRYAFESQTWFKGCDFLGSYGGNNRYLGKLLYMDPDLGRGRFDSRMLSNGFTFTNSPKTLIKKLEALQAKTPQQLFKDEFGVCDRDELVRKVIDGKSFVRVKGDWRSAAKIDTKLDAWDKKIGKRADWLPFTAAIAIEALRRARPKHLHFGPQSIDTAVLDFVFNLG